MQPGDIVESVDMEMSDDEVDGKQKSGGSRVLVDLRPQDRDLRVSQPPPGHHPDMEMRMIPLPSGQMPSHPPLLQTPDSHSIRQNLGQFHHGQQQQDFRVNQLNFHQNRTEFHQNQQNFHQNSQPEFRHNTEPTGRTNQLKNFHQNQQEFYPNQQQDFRQNQQQQEFEFKENQNRRRISQEFQGEPLQCGRYSLTIDHHQRESPGFQRNERGRGRGFPRNRRDRFSEEQHVQRGSLSLINNQRPKHVESEKSVAEILPNNRPLLLRPPDTVVVLDDDGTPISIPTENETRQTVPASINAEEKTPSEEQEEKQDNDERDSVPRIPAEEPSPIDASNQNSAPPDQILDQQIRLSSSEEAPVKIEESNNNPSTDVTETKPDILQNEEILKNVDSVKSEKFQETQSQDQEQQPRQLSEQLEALMNSKNKQQTTNNNLKRQSENGGESINQQDEGTPIKKRPLLPNGPPLSHLTGGPLMSGGHLLGPNGTLMTPGGPIEIHPVVVYEYDNSNSGFRPRGGGGSPFPPWRGSGLPRGRGGFRGGPRLPWVDRGGRGGGMRETFSARGQKRGPGGGGGVGGQFRGGFRGRGRGGNNW